MAHKNRKITKKRGSRTCSNLFLYKRKTLTKKKGAQNSFRILATKIAKQF